MHGSFIDLTPLRSSSGFRRLWLGGLVSAFAAQLAVVAVLFHVWEETGSPLWTGMVGLVSAAAMTAGSLLGGTAADRYDRTRVLRWTTLGQLLAGLGLTVQALPDLALGAAPGVTLVLVLVAANAFCAGFGAASRRSLPARLLDHLQLPAGIALLHLGVQGALLLGPAIGGVVIGAFGLAACFGICAAALCVALWTVLRLPPVPPPAATGASPWAMTREGLRHVSRPGAVRGAFGTDLFATLLVMPVSLFPMINEMRLDGAPETLGMMTSSVAVGGLLAGLLSGAVMRRQRLGRIQSGAAAVWCLALIGYGLSPTLGTILLCLAVAGAADTVSVIARGAIVQLVTPDARRGRVSAAEHVIGAAGPDVGNARSGLVAQLVGAPASLVGGGILALIGIGWIAARNRHLRDFRRSDFSGGDQTDTL
ncbi:MFS transporter [Nesterenkonia sp. HG001]|uniref:MFS transporter n=1 Tax=Nesterenkonia sp. HG001 TaxID=2983207 RepID=UPI002AC38181|nr:MFS transporter [Nesterenkonia sp. HG001]MDZ5078745.1 MFS transporter [Nesterenkonia sp. HG001]